MPLVLAFYAEILSGSDILVLSRFTIRVDQLAVIKEILKEHQMREELNNPKAVLSQISKAKNDFVTPEMYMQAGGQLLRRKYRKNLPRVPRLSSREQFP